MGLVFSIGGLAFPIVALWNSRAVVPFVGVMAIFGIGIIIRRGQRKSLLAWDKWLLIGTLGFLVAVIVGAFHVADINEAFVSTSKIFANALVAAFLLIAATYLTSKEIWAAARCVAFSTCVVGGFLLIDILTSGTLSLFFTNMTYTPKYKFFWFKSASTTFAICTLITAFYLALKKQYWQCACLLAGAIFIQINIGNRTAAGGLILALACGFVYQVLGKYRQFILASAIVILFLTPTYIHTLGFSGEKISQLINVRTSATISFVYRMHAWEFVIQRINERPLFGWGLDGSKEFGGETTQVISDSVMGPLGEPVPLHPHNGVLEVWLELGAFGAFALLLLVLRGAKVFENQCASALNRVCTFSILTLLTCFFAFSYSAFSSAWIANMIFALSMTYALARYRPPDNVSDLVSNGE